jgi:hypothetical protein
LGLLGEKGKKSLLDPEELNLVWRANDELCVVVIHKVKCVESSSPDSLRSVAP